MKKSRHPTPNAWYKRKRYLHFDFSLQKKEAVNYVLNKENIIKHSFSPLIHYIKTSRQYKRDKKTNQLRIFRKPRNIFYASHIDGYIYGYYTHIIGQKYESYLERYDLHKNILAYRLVEKNDQNGSNIHFADEAFEFIRATGGCNVLCIDISSFFDKLCTDVLKRNWSRVWSGDDIEKLEEDHYRVFMSLKNFRYIEEEDIVRVFNKEPRRRSDIDKDDKNAQKQERKRSLHERICSFSELRDKKLSVDNNQLLRRKSILEITGIPQGTAISGMLANIFMIEFDQTLKTTIEKQGGLYRRYSDDILLVFPTSIDFQSMESHVEDILKEFSRGSLKINSKKTDRCIYRVSDNNVGVCYNEEGKRSPVQYLGFVFDGTKKYIRSSSISRNRSKISYLIKKNKKNAGSINTRRVYKAQSPRKITPSDKYENKGFVFYAKRSEDIQGAVEIKKQIAKNDRFIRNKIAKERKGVPKVKIRQAYSKSI